MKTSLSFSGGSNSVALLLKLIETGNRPDIILHADTGMLFPEEYEFMKRVEDYVGQKITHIKPDMSWEEYFYRRKTKGKYIGTINGFPGVSFGCGFSRVAKMNPLDRVNKDYDIVYVGFHCNETNRIMKSPKFRYPLIEMNLSGEDCKRICIEHNLLNPVYEMGIGRAGNCYCCPYKNKKSLQIIKLNYPDLWEKMLIWEQDSPFGFKPGITLTNI